MKPESILIVDDEQNIRFTISEALAELPASIETASTGEEAQKKVEQKPYSLVLLDLRMPGMDGMEVLRWLRDSRPEIPVVIITAHGTIDTAVDAMRLGAIDFLQKPFTPEQIRSQVQRVLDRGKLRDGKADDYAARFELAKHCLSERHTDAAVEHLHKAISLAPERPEAFNMLGAIHEMRGALPEALSNYRAAWNFDPTYEAAKQNLERATSERPRSGKILLGELRDDSGSFSDAIRRA
ncbi:MAG TPA: response regulator [Pirellulales bacterium]|jgi:DNA-binding response OmpR family regulator|nr:response regulator [Pirellulales bacterium]